MAAVIFYSGIGAVSVNAGPWSNEYIFSKTIEIAAAAVVDSFNIVPGMVRAGQETGLDGLALEAFLSALRNKGWVVSSRGDSSDLADSYEPIVRLSALRFEYEKAGSGGFFKKPKVRRNLQGQIYLGLAGPVDFGGYRQFAYSDTISYADANYVGSRKYKELAPELFVTGAGKYVEPAVVIATVGGLIYLFFNSR